MKKYILLVPFVICLLVGCNSESLEDDTLIYYKRTFSRNPLELWIGKDKVDFDGIDVTDILFDSYTKETYVLSGSKENYHVYMYKIQNASINKFEYSEIPLECYYYKRFVFKNEVLFSIGLGSYILFDLATDTLQEIKLPLDASDCNRYTDSGFDTDCIYFNEGYFSLKEKAYSSYLSEIDFYRNRICPKEQKVLFTTHKNKRIGLYDLASKKVEELPIKCDYNYSSEYMYFLSDENLYYSKYANNWRNFFSWVFPGDHKELTWYKYNLRTGEKNKVLQKNDGGIYIVLGGL